MSRFYKANEEITLRFYQMPKVLFNNPKYKGLSLGAKAMYSILRDRQELSISNNLKNEESWVDSEGNIYLVFPVEPKKDDDRSVEEKEPRELSLTELLDINKNTVTAYRKELIRYELIIDKKVGQGRPSRIYVLKPELPDGVVRQTIGNALTPKKQDSRIPKNSIPDSQKSTGSDTDFSDTDFSDTIFPSPKLSTETKENERVSEFKQILNNLNLGDFGDYAGSVLDALRILHYSDKPLQINGIKIPCKEVREDLRRVEWGHIDLALRDLKNASMDREINNIPAYLSVCIYNSIFNSNLKLEAEINFNKSI